MPRRKSSKPLNLSTPIKSADAHVGARVRSRRLQLRMSQTALGEATGLSFQQIQKYERGANRISASRLQEIAIVLGVTPFYFFENQLPAVGAESCGISAQAFDDFVASADGVRLMQAFVKIKNKAMQEIIAKLVSYLEG
jgi:transcriptional regulator with XRE-family HTH domain